MIEIVVAAVGALGTGVGAVVALLAQRAARKSAQAAEASAQAARESLDLQRAEAARALERADVVWARVKARADPGLIRIRNVGSTTAHEVTAVLRVNGRQHVVSAAAVAPDEELHLDARAEYDAARQRAADRMRAARSAGVVSLSYPRFKVHARITWETELGSPGVQSIE